MRKIDGVHCFFFYGEKLVTATLPREDFVINEHEGKGNKFPKGKREKDLYYHAHDIDLIPLKPNDISWVSGAINSGETPDEAMQREIREETGIVPEWGTVQAMIAPFTQTIQVRDTNEPKLIEGRAYCYELSDSGLTILKARLAELNRQVFIYSVSELLNGKRGFLRPFAQGAIGILNGSYP